MLKKFPTEQFQQKLKYNKSFIKCYSPGWDFNIVVKIS